MGQVKGGGGGKASITCRSQFTVYGIYSSDCITGIRGVFIGLMRIIFRYKVEGSSTRGYGRSIEWTGIEYS